MLRVDEIGRPWHYCPACQRLHPLPSDTGKRTFNQNFEKPTFTPSFKHTWRRSAGEYICHYVITDGVITYCPDSTHAMNTSVIPMPPIPEDAE